MPLPVGVNGGHSLLDVSNFLADRNERALSFNIYEVVAKVGNQEPPMPQDCHYEILHEKRRKFISCYLVVAIHPLGQVAITTKQHQRAHFGVLRPAILPLVHYLQSQDEHFPIRFYSSTVPRHDDEYLIIVNGSSMSASLPSYPLLPFQMVTDLTCQQKEGQRGNMQVSYGWAFQNQNKGDDPESIINCPQAKLDNVSSGAMKVFPIASRLLHEVDPAYKFHKLLEEDPERH